MQTETPEVSDKSSASADMSEAVMSEMNGIVREAMGPWAAGDSIKVGLDRAARRLGINFRRARGLYHGEARAILAHEADLLRAWHRAHIEQEEKRLETRAAGLSARRAALRECLDDLDTAMAGQRELRFG